MPLLEVGQVENQLMLESVMLGPRHPVWYFQKKPHANLRISFIDEDTILDQYPHKDPIVIDVKVGDYRVHRVLINSGSLTDIIYWHAKERMGVSDDHIRPVCKSLVGFSGDLIMPEQTVMFPLTLKKSQRCRTEMIKKPSSYDMALG
ncbi:hypothetical protein ACH5RR_021273 [Cinchona calisaya]|uniref:Uncharacterized protein n=1 Tax=Cinchona calisaya TaxID=153742 RepID=A0ABD2ZGV5_9GENT